MEEEITAKVQVERDQKDDEESENYASHHIDEKEFSEQGGGGSEEKINPVMLKKHAQVQKGGHQKKHKSEKQTHIDPMVLTEGNLHEISDKIRDTTTKVSQQFEHQYMQMLRSIQKDLHELQIQANRIQVDFRKASAAQVSLTQGWSIVSQIEQPQDLRVFLLLEGSVPVK